MSRGIFPIKTSVPLEGVSASQMVFGGGPPYFRWPVVTSRLYFVRWSNSLIFPSSGCPWGVGCNRPSAIAFWRFKRFFKKIYDWEDFNQMKEVLPDGTSSWLRREKLTYFGRERGLNHEIVAKRHTPPHSRTPSTRRKHARQVLRA